MPTYWGYILTNTSRNVMYVGVTNNLENRIAQHREASRDSFTGRYNVTTLVYAEDYQYVEDAIAREKQIKGWRRSKKNELVEAANPTWADLLEVPPSKDPSLPRYFRIAWLSSGVSGRSRKERMRPRIVPKPVCASSFAG